MAENESSAATPPDAVAVSLVRRRAWLGQSPLRIVLEVALIATGVFLGLAGDQWRETRQNRELAEAALRRFRAELVANRDAVRTVEAYHVDTLETVRAYLSADRSSRNSADVRMQGLQPVSFEHTAWDLALATESLAYIDPDLAFALSRLYNAQEQYAGLSRGITQAMYLLPVRENFDAFVAAVETYFSDLVIMEPRLLALYDELLPMLDRALGEPR